MATVALTAFRKEDREILLKGMTPTQRRKAQQCAERWDKQSRQIRGWTTPVAIPRENGWTFRIVADASEWPEGARPLTGLRF
jgi:hypothetical protein